MLAVFLSFVGARRRRCNSHEPPVERTKLEVDALERAQALESAADSAAVDVAEDTNDADSPRQG